MAISCLWRLGMARAVLFNHPDQIEQVLLTRHQDFVRYRFFWQHVARAADQHRRHVAEPACLDGVGVSRRPAGRLRRRHRPPCQRLSETWQNGEECDVREQVTRLTMRIAARALFGLDLENDADGNTRAVDCGIAEVSNRLERGFFLPRLGRTSSELRRIATWA